MAFIDYLSDIPEAKREAFKAEIAQTEKAIYINSKEDAQKIVDSNELLKQINQADRDRRYADMVKKFEAETLPKLLEAERAKGQKQPWEIKIEEMEKRAAEKDRALNIERQRNKAIAKASEIGVPANLIDRFVGETDEETESGLKILAETLIPWRDAATKAAVEKIGSQGKPVGGIIGDQKTLEAQYSEAVAKNDGMAMLRIKSQMQEAAERRTRQV